MKALIFMLIFAIFVIDNSFAQLFGCDYKVEILVNNTEFESKDFSWRMRATKIEGKSTNITGTAEIEDSRGNIVKWYNPWANDSISKQKTSNTYSPNLKEGQYNVKSYINVSCDDEDKGNNVDIKTITIKERNQEINTVITQHSNQNIQVEEKINKATISESTIMDEKSENKSLNKEDAGNLMTTGDEGNVIQLKDSTDIKIEAKLTAEAVKEPEVVYESSNEKAKNIIIIFLLGISILLNIVLIWKR